MISEVESCEWIVVPNEHDALILKLFNQTTKTKIQYLTSLMIKPIHIS